MEDLVHITKSLAKSSKKLNPHIPDGAKKLEPATPEEVERWMTDPSEWEPLEPDPTVEVESDD